MKLRDLIKMLLHITHIRTMAIMLPSCGI